MIKNKMTREELRTHKEARYICAWLEYRYIKPPKELLEIAVDKKFRAGVLGNYPKLNIEL